MRRSTVAGFALFVIWSEGAAQPSATSLPAGVIRSVGSTVRIRSATDGLHEGRLAGVRSDSLVLVTPGGQRLTRFGSSDTLWIRVRPVKAGAVFGGITGLALIGGMFALFATTCGSGDDPCTGLGGAVPLFVAIPAIGAAIGAAAGVAASHWRRRYP